MRRCTDSRCCLFHGVAALAQRIDGPYRPVAVGARRVLVTDRGIFDPGEFAVTLCTGSRELPQLFKITAGGRRLGSSASPCRGGTEQDMACPGEGHVSKPPFLPFAVGEGVFGKELLALEP